MRVSGGGCRLQGIVRRIERTGEVKRDEEGLEWRRCVLEVELVRFSRRCPGVQLPDHLRGKVVKVTRWLSHDWHYRVGARVTLSPEETEAVLRGEGSPLGARI